MKKSKLTAAVLSAALAFQGVGAILTPNTYSAEDLPRQMEYLDRGTVAVATDYGIFVSWRLLGTENYDTAFKIYRDGEYIANISSSTNYLDTDGTATSTYTVVTTEEDEADGKTVPVWGDGYLEIPLDVPADMECFDGTIATYTPNDAAVADLDGDGEYEIILKWEPSNAFDSGKTAAYTGNVYIDAYELNGEKLWRIDLGININAGAHFTQIAAYDLDLDGKAEIAMKTAPGSKDGTGKYVSDASLIDEIRETDNTDDCRSSDDCSYDTDGRVLSGDEYYTVFDGSTGAALDTIYYPHPRGTITEWGDNWGNRSERYLTAVAYLDGVNPSVIAWRGYYAKTTATAYNLVNKRLVEVADFNTDDKGNEQYAGQGNHNLTVGDVDNDGCDEIICGSLALDNDFSVLWCSGRGHGDALHLGDYDPTHEGMEYFSVHESSPYGMTVYDAATGEELFHQDASGDTGRGMMANFTGDGYYDVWASGVGTYYSIGGDLLYESDDTPDSTNFRIFWSDSTYDCLLDGTGSYDTTFKIDSKDGRLQTFSDTKSNNYTKCNPCIQADILGDWREEILVRSSDNTSLRLYTTTMVTPHKLYTLMHDSAYRMQTVCQNAGYNQPPHISYYINDADDQYDCRKYSSYVSTVHNGKTAVRTENLPSEKPSETVPPSTPIPTAAPESCYTIDEDGVITAYTGTDEVLVIPETIDGITVTGIGAKVFMSNKTLQSVTIPSSVTSIGAQAFCYCAASEITLPEGLETIGVRAFKQCSNLTSIDIPKSVTEIGDEAFYYSTALSSVTLHEGLQSIGSSAFEQCTSLSDITLPESVTTIGSSAFEQCTSLSDITLPEKVTEIADSLFMNCTSLSSVTLHDNITSIATKAFYNCGLLENIELPKNLTELGGYTFYKCTSLTELDIPDGVTVIPSYCAYQCTALNKVTLPDNLVEIKQRAFAYCSSLPEITIMPDVTTIGSNVFNKVADDFTIYGYTNSTAEEYAEKYSINFVSIGEFIATPAPTINATLPPMPTCDPEAAVQVTTGDATDITKTSAVLNGSIEGSTSAWAIFYHCIAPTEGVLYNAQGFILGGDDADGSGTLTDLTPATRYIYYAYDSVTQTRGEIKEFTTLGESPTEEPTELPTEEPTEMPTETPTEAPTEAPYQYPYRVVDDSATEDTYTFTVERYEQSLPAVVICAQYDTDGALKSVELRELSGDEEEVFELEFKRYANTACVFVWESVKTMMPIAARFDVTE